MSNGVYLILHERNDCRGKVFFQMFKACDARNRQHVFIAVQLPREGELLQRYSMLFGDRVKHCVKTRCAIAFVAFLSTRMVEKFLSSPTAWRIPGSAFALSSCLPPPLMASIPTALTDSMWISPSEAKSSYAVDARPVSIRQASSVTSRDSSR